MMRLNKNLVFGAATASFQIEGGAYADGKGLSVWDVFCKKESTIFQNNNGDTACNSYALWKEDIALLKNMGVDAYRFSVSWPRVMPKGRGAVNQKGLDYYKRLAATLRDNGIEPYITLYHWDLPYELSLCGGLMNRDFASWFADYAELISRSLGGDAETYFTFNEPQSIVGAGYGLGTFAPGIAVGNAGSFPALHNLLLAHGDACRALKANGKKTAIVNCGDAPYPEDENDAELIEAVRKKTFSAEYVWSYVNVFDPVFLGDYCAEFYKRFQREADYFIKDGDLERIFGTTDFCCMNHYNGYAMRFKDGKTENSPHTPGKASMMTGWQVDEKGLYWTMKFLQERYNVPLMLSENGMSCHDFPSSDGCVHDANRVEYFNRYLTQVARAIKDGIDIKAYFAWSLLDNFEWLSGYSQRFGLVYVDFETYERIPKDSFYFLKELLAARKREEE